MALRAPQPSTTVFSGTALLEISKIANELTGIQLNEKHFSMIISRLNKHLSEVGVSNLDEYLVYFQKNKEQESKFIISTLTTHHTYFFREIAHFEFLTDRGISFLAEKVRARPDKTLRIWSAACSRGQEVYSLAMHVSEILSKNYPDLKLEILGTDVDPESVAIAKNGVYPWKEVKEIPLHHLGKSWVRGQGEISEFAKVKSNIRSVCTFEPQNLLNIKLQKKRSFDIIFCRNVFIYFNTDQIKTITKSLSEYLNPEGFLFLGISESLHGLDLPMKPVGTSIYAKETHPWVNNKKATQTRAVEIKSEPQRNLRIMVVDDSPVIHKLMEQIFTKDLGFEIVAHANDGLEAAELLKKTKVDALTLDIHMPNQDGVEYLRSNYNSKHPPVIMVTSVSREDSTLAAQALDIGASDYVEKPALNNLKERAEEIRTKVRCAIRAKEEHDQSLKTETSLDHAFQHKFVLEKPETKARIVTFHGADRKRVQKLVSNFTKPSYPPTILIVDSNLQGAELIKTQIEKDLGRRIKNEDDIKSQGLKSGELYLLFLSENLGKSIEALCKDRRISILALGDTSQLLANEISKLPSSSSHLVIEDLETQKINHRLRSRASEISPLTGFAYISDRYLCEK